MILNDRILQAILTLATELHFGRAAARLHVSQPALSGTLRELERHLGVCLFRRTSRHVELTEAGQTFVAQAQLLIEQGERTIRLVRESSPDILGPLRIGYPASINLRWLCSLISHAQSERSLAAGLQFVTTENLNPGDDLVNRTMHAAFFEGRLYHPELQCLTLFQEPFLVVLNARHPFSQSHLLGLSQLRDEPVVWLRRDVNPLLHDSFMALCSSQGYHPDIVQEVRTYHECLEFARAALAITFVPSNLQSTYQDQEIRFIRLPEGTLYAEYSLAYPRKEISQSVVRFAKFVQKHVPIRDAVNTGDSSAAAMDVQ